MFYATAFRIFSRLLRFGNDSMLYVLLNVDCVLFVLFSGEKICRLLPSAWCYRDFAIFSKKIRRYIYSSAVLHGDASRKITLHAWVGHFALRGYAQGPPRLDWQKIITESFQLVNLEDVMTCSMKMLKQVWAILLTCVPDNSVGQSCMLCSSYKSHDPNKNW